MLDFLLPGGIESAEIFGEPPGGDLLPAEARAVSRAVETRRREYAAVRRCARACLRRLGYPDSPLLSAANGAPSWPPGATGSLTHCAGYVAAAVGRTTDVAGIGIDAEPDEPLPAGVLETVATLRERRLLADALPDPDDPCWERLLFSAKEAVFKAWSTLVGEWLDPEDTEILLGRDTGTFLAVVSAGSPAVPARAVTSFQGRWTRGGGILLTAVVLPRRPDGGASGARPRAVAAAWRSGTGSRRATGSTSLSVSTS